MSRLSGIGGRLYRGETSIDFVGRRKTWYGISALFLIVSAAALGIQGLKLGIEFKGGSSYMVTTSNPSVADAQSAVTASGYTGEAVIQKIGTNKIRVQTGALSNAASNALQSQLASTFKVDINNIDTQSIGPSWGKEITRKALYGLFGFLIVVLYFLGINDLQGFGLAQ
jgi:preprotein translocase subunit SecF